MLEKLDMGKYALYVWGSFGATAFLMILEPLLVRQQRNAVIKRVARMVRMKQEKDHESSS